MTSPMPRRRRPPPPPPPPPPTPPDRYETYSDFYEEELRWLYPRNLVGPQYRWCNQWRLHVDVVDRVTALWQAWEQAMRDGGSAHAAWYANYADPIMRELLCKENTFAGCEADERHAPKNGPLPTID